ncbi:MAG TPA: nuclear transport factor 2 family protein [Sphingomonadaceae bacterium]|nr:nuclear transport factor 2 family protein [Sphingomonadaceae bacterium]
MGHTAEEERNLQVCTEMYHRMLMQFDSSVIDTYIADDYIQHSTGATDGKEGLRTFLDEHKTAYPDIEMRIKKRLADGDCTVFHVHVTRHAGDPGLAAVDIFRLVDGKVKEHWETLQEIPATLPHGNGIF